MNDQAGDIESRSGRPAGQLVLLGGPKADVLPLTDRGLVLGREPSEVEGEDVFVLAGSGVSSRHCRIEPWNGGYRVRDLGSEKGISVNGRRTRVAALEPFDCVRVCGYALVYLDADTDPRKVINIMGRHERPDFAQATPREDELLALTLSVPDLGARGDLVAQLEELLGGVQSLLSCDSVLLVLIEARDEGERLRVIHGELAAGEDLGRLLPLVSKSLTQGRMCSGSGQLGSSAPTLCFPIRHRPWAGSNERRHPGAEIRGALLLKPKPGNPLSGASRQLVLALARQLAVLLSNARLLRQATVDPLTGLANRGSLEGALQTEFRRAEREGSPLGVLLLDIDDFKLVNDELGHEVGDQVLRCLGAMLRGTLRGDDLAGRWGGEEFLVLLPGADASGSETVAQKLIAVLAASPNEAGIPPSSVSIGVAAFPAHGQTPKLLLRHADQALYQAKRAGKCCARVYGAVEPSPTPVPTSSRHHDTYSQTRAAAPREKPAARAWLLNDLRPPILLCRATATSLGRSVACDVVLPYPTVSRLHCVIHVDEADVIRLDDASSNGVVLNGEVMEKQSTELNAGDRVTIGPYDFEVSEVRRDSGNETQAGGKLLGSLHPSRVSRLLRWLGESLATGVLTVAGEDQEGQVELRDGKLIRASTLAGLRGEEAVGVLLGQSEGRYCYVRQEVAGRAEIDSGLLKSLGELEHAASQEDLLLDSSTRLQRMGVATARPRSRRR